MKEEWKHPVYDKPTKSHKIEDETLKVKLTEWGSGDYYPTDEREEFIGYDKDKEQFINKFGQEFKIKTSTLDINFFMEV